MKDFDILQATLTAYRILWRERGYLIALAILPMSIILVNFIVLQIWMPDVSPLRQGLLLLPAIVAEGWLVTQFLRTLLTGERWPRPRPSPDDRAALQRVAHRTRNLTVALLIYILTSLLLNLLLALMVAYGGTTKIESGDNPPAMLGFLGLVMLAAGIFGFRYLWLFVPALVGFPLRFYDRALRGFMPSLQLIGICLACYLPVIAVTFTLLGLLQGLIVPPDQAEQVLTGAGSPGPVLAILLTVLDVVSRVMMSLAAAVGLTVALRPLLAPGALLLSANDNAVPPPRA